MSDLGLGESLSASLSSFLFVVAKLFWALNDLLSSFFRRRRFKKPRRLLGSLFLSFYPFCIVAVFLFKKSFIKFMIIQKPYQLLELGIKMKAAILACVLLGMAASAYAEEEYSIDQSEGRFLYFNTSSTATSLTLLGALILLGVIGYLVYVGGLLGTSNYNRNDYYDAAAYADPNAQYYQQAQYR